MHLKLRTEEGNPKNIIIPHEMEIFSTPSYMKSQNEISYSLREDSLLQPLGYISPSICNNSIQKQEFGNILKNDL